MVNVVITMGGVGSRFSKAGYKDPKYMIEVKGKSLFEWSILSLRSFIYPENTFIFIVKSIDNAKGFIEEKCRNLGIHNKIIMEIDLLTDGQATTALFAQEYWKPDDRLLIYNIDTHIHPDSIMQEDFHGDGWIPCFDGPGASWSFVKINENGEAIEVREKQRISRHATIGLYGFSSARLYESLYKQYYNDERNIEKGEKYVAPLYNQLIENGGIVTIKDIPIESVQVIGTPEELEVFKGNNYNL